MTDVTGTKEFVAFGDQEERPPDAQPERVVMVAPDGRTVQVMVEDVTGFAERAFVLAATVEPTPEAPSKPKRTKSVPVESEEES